MDRLHRTLGARAALVTSLALAASPAATAYRAPVQPNVVLVVVDDLRFDDIGAAGHPFVATPHIDRLAREGARFTDFFATTPLCSPSRASILTGLYTRHHGILDNTDRSAASHELASFPRRLQAAGYEIGFVGKWHMGNDPSRRPGFDYWVAMRGQGEANDPWLEEGSRRGLVPGYVTDVLTDPALAFVRQSRTRPFFLMLAHKALHPNIAQHADGSTSDIGEGGFVPAPRHRSLYAASPLPRRASYGVPPRGKPALERRIGSLPPLGPATATPDATIRDRLRMGYDAVRTRRHKYVRYRELAGMDELYDLATDPYELENLASAPGRDALRAELAAELDRLLAR